MRVRVDTSVWSLALRRVAHAQNPDAEELKRLIARYPLSRKVIVGDKG